MSRSLQNQIRAMNSERFSSETISFACHKIVSISSEGLEDLPFESIHSLLEVIQKVMKYFQNTSVIEAQRNKHELKKLSAQISTFISLLNTHYSIVNTIELNLGSLNYHELEQIALKNQLRIDKELSKLNVKRDYIKAKSEYLHYSLKALIQKPVYKLKSNEYVDGLLAFFPHEDDKIQSHKMKLNEEIDEQLKEFSLKYGSGFIQKVVRNRKKWDNDYYPEYINVSNKLDILVAEREEMFKNVHGDKSEISETSLSDSSTNTEFGDLFAEGNVCNLMSFTLVDMELCRIRCFAKPLKCEDDDVEILVEW
ncbi:hypothetical protein SteCoe_22184 [Stentor coeruleus]|uniref:Uncharacterized protein n=1 Tax=Stentor coeruleus TaxID=5963 RepID=A0A1R2BMU4_9CILI|nr:hypothetical protein SteCoe_22184 [Stentor coeruleus]